MSMMKKQWTKTNKKKIIKKLNDYLDKIIDKSQSFEDIDKKSKKSRWLLLC